MRDSLAKNKITKITVIGTGYLGATHAAAMAELGFEVLGVDVDVLKVERLSRGQLPFFEPGLPELLKEHISSGRLRFTTSMQEAAEFGDIHFIAVGTPQLDGMDAADMTYVEGAITELSSHISRDCVIVGKSTVPVGSARRLRNLIEMNKSNDSNVGLAWNPEFLREGFAVEDTLRPDRIVVGTDEEWVLDQLRVVYAEALGNGIPFISTDFETAELVKVAANAFLATKISFINAFAEVTEVAGGDIRTLADAIGYDARIGRRFLNAGVGFGGGCLPKDIRALQARISELGLDRTMGFLKEVDDINSRRRDRVVRVASQIVGQVQGRNIAVLGSTFKPNSDDVRDSPALDIASRLYSEGANVRVYDPKGIVNSRIRFPRLDYRPSLQDAVSDADLVLLLTEWDEFKNMDPEVIGNLVRSRKILDGRGVLDSSTWLEAGWEFGALGKKEILFPSAAPTPEMA